MNKLNERRNINRIDLSLIEVFFRQCDVSASAAGEDLDITILNISSDGMKFRINTECESQKINLNDEIFIRGCIFNDRIGFLSSQKAVAVWQDDLEFGARFTPKLDLDEESLRAMLA